MDLIHIGMPVRNEGKYIRKALDSLLNQNFKDIKIFISDNVSNDETSLICKEYCIRDERIKYFKTPTLLNGLQNFNYVFNLASTSRYFMWMSGHDVLGPSYILSCLEEFKKNPKATIVYSLIKLIDTSDNSLRTTSQRLDTREVGLILRPSKVLFNAYASNVVYGLIKTDTIKKTNIFKNILCSDTLFMLEMSLFGEFIQIDKTLYHRRDSRPGETKEEYVKKSVNNIYKSKNNYPVIFHYFYLIFCFIKIIYQNKSLSWHKKISIIVCIMAICVAIALGLTKNEN